MFLREEKIALLNNVKMNYFFSRRNFLLHGFRISTAEHRRKSESFQEICMYVFILLIFILNNLYYHKTMILQVNALQSHVQ